jgi:hypothetical protein
MLRFAGPESLYRKHILVEIVVCRIGAEPLVGKTDIQTMGKDEAVAVVKIAKKHSGEIKREQLLDSWEQGAEISL